MKLGIPGINVTALDARDKTQLKERMIREGRYIDFEIGGYGRPLSDDFPVPNSINVTTVFYKNMTIAQLQQGAYWFLWKFYDFDNFLSRMKKFLSDFENSPVKDTLKLPSFSTEQQQKGLLKTVGTFQRNEATEEEARLIDNAFVLAGKTSIPNKWMIIIRGIINVINVKRLLLKQFPEIDKLEYPKEIPLEEIHRQKVPKTFEELKDKFDKAMSHNMVMLR
jgi:hypothetical protein